MAVADRRHRRVSRRRRAIERHAGTDDFGLRLGWFRAVTGQQEHHEQEGSSSHHVSPREDQNNVRYARNPRYAFADVRFGSHTTLRSSQRSTRHGHGTDGSGRRSSPTQGASAPALSGSHKPSSVNRRSSSFRCRSAASPHARSSSGENTTAIVGGPSQPTATSKKTSGDVLAGAQTARCKNSTWDAEPPQPAR